MTATDRPPAPTGAPATDRLWNPLDPDELARWRDCLTIRGVDRLPLSLG